MMQTQFRLAGQADMALVLELMREFYEYESREFSFTSTLNEGVARAALAQLFANPSLGRVWLIGHEKEAIGYVALTFCFSLEFGGPAAVVDELYVRESHRGRGVGMKTLQFVEDFCRSQGIRMLALEVDRANMVAQKLYAKAGYEDRNNYLLTRRL
ncbi:MAG TPA: GNAT family N-acetyltransferase [Blastocatellia bacterium]|nr:GNAT family N-acetyltransferase [Blastocatellia bacterium]